MAENEPKWYSIFVVLFGTILSFADPITDILTLVEFYRADHKTWFGVGLIFIILPSLFFLFANCNFECVSDDQELNQEGCVSIACKGTRVLVCGCSPFLPAWLKLRTLYLYLKTLLNLRQGNNTDQTDKDLDELPWSRKFAVMTEAALESAPQFIIQLYAMAVQQQSVTIIQMVSLPVSFLSLVWGSTVADEFLHSDEGELDYSFKDTVLLFVTHLFILSSRLFAVALFTVSYTWWVTGVLIVHCTVITICDTVCQCKGQSFGCTNAFLSVLFVCFYWLRDDLSTRIGDENTQNKKKHARRMRLISNVLFVIENIIMILLFYFSHFPHTWYSLPVTICVCLFAVLGALMRLTYFFFLEKELDGRSNNTDQVQQQSHSNPVEVAAT